MNNQVKNEERVQWKESFKKRPLSFSVNVLRLSDELNKNRTLWAVSNQVIRSATSIGANVREAQGSGSKKDFANYFQIALKSAHETRYWLEVVCEYDSSYASEVAKLLSEIDEIARIINSSLLTMKGKK